MFESVIDDIKAQFTYGNMIARIILVNLFFLIVINLVKVFSPSGSGFFNEFIHYVGLPAVAFDWMTRPWTLITHMFSHIGLWHFAWNMIMLYWFGRIVGDLIGDKKVLPLYLLGGIAGGLAFILWAQISGFGGFAIGASGAVNCFVLAAACIAPEYELRLLFIGNVKLKYVALTLILVDLLFSSAGNPGGTAAHMGGAAMGGLYVYLLQRGRDLTLPLQNLFSARSDRQKRKSKAPMQVVYHKKRPERVQSQEPRTQDTQEKIDEILDKINVSGYDSLTKEEKEFLYQASKK